MFLTIDLLYQNRKASLLDFVDVVLSGVNNVHNIIDVVKFSTSDVRDLRVDFVRAEVLDKGFDGAHFGMVFGVLISDVDGCSNALMTSLLGNFLRDIFCNIQDFVRDVDVNGDGRDVLTVDIAIDMAIVMDDINDLSNESEV